MFQEMLQGGGSVENFVQSGTTPISTESFQKITTPFKPNKVLINIYKSSTYGATFIIDRDSSDNSLASGTYKEGSTSGIIQNISYNKYFRFLDDGFEFSGDHSGATEYGVAWDYVAIT